MVKHIVFWKLEENAGGRSKQENFQLMKQKLEALVGIVPGLLSAQVGYNYNGGDYDVALVLDVESRGALEAYRVHPAHKEVQKFVHSVICGRTAVDFE
ncbi:MAG: Dabb family protein [Clostridiales bacterium]|nr:Dabb family protein [Clostridiales bacterium]